MVGTMPPSYPHDPPRPPTLPPNVVVVPCSVVVVETSVTRLVISIHQPRMTLLCQGLFPRHLSQCRLLPSPRPHLPPRASLHPLLLKRHHPHLLHQRRRHPCHPH
eukprot:Rmarinus@m.20380